MTSRIFHDKLIIIKRGGIVIMPQYRDDIVFPVCPFNPMSEDGYYGRHTDWTSKDFKERRGKIYDTIRDFEGGASTQESRAVILADEEFLIDMGDPRIFEKQPARELAWKAGFWQKFAAEAQKNKPMDPRLMDFAARDFRRIELLLQDSCLGAIEKTRFESYKAHMEYKFGPKIFEQLEQRAKELEEAATRKQPLY